MKEYMWSKEKVMDLEELGKAVFSAKSNVAAGKYEHIHGFGDCPCPCPPVVNAVLYVTFSPIF